jgi:hypothetical protein
MCLHFGRFTAVVALACMSLAATSEVGSTATLTGSLFFSGATSVNWYDPNSLGRVPAGFANSLSNIVTVTSYPFTFGYADSANQDNTTFNSATSFTFQDTVTNYTGPNNPVELQFVSSVLGFFDVFAVLSDNFPGGFTDTISPDGTTITLNWAGGSVTSGDVFDVTVGVTGATPLPAALPLFATGIGGLGFLGWRRRRKARAVT